MDELLVPRLLTDPFLLQPTPTSIKVVWFTEFQGVEHRVIYGTGEQEDAITSPLTRIREDSQSHLPSDASFQLASKTPQLRPIWRHEAVIAAPGQPLPYHVESTHNNGEVIKSKTYTLAATPPLGAALKILLTSDHQLKPMVAANLQKVIETVGTVDAIFYAGDLVNVPDRASEWFDDARGNAWFRCLQGRAVGDYQGGELLQNAPIFTTVGNHEVMGRYSEQSSLHAQFKDPVPVSAASDEGPLQDQSFNTITYDEIFKGRSFGEPQYYAVTFGDIRLIVLYVANVFRSPALTPETKGKYHERDQDLQQPEQWGYGQHIFESIAPGSPQYEWLQAELDSAAFQQAKYKIALWHHPVHSLGGNVVPAYTDPVQVIDRNGAGQVRRVRYEYPMEADYLVRDVLPLLEEAGVQLAMYGHCHLWNRFVSKAGTHYLETSNVGNSYGAAVCDRKRTIPTTYRETYAATGNPNGLDPVMPTLAPLKDLRGQPLPYIASNTITVFSILDTESGSVSSYRFDTQKPESPVIKFDEFFL
ncbi:MAG: metallophosphoesterase family protein [Thermosynechococcaceae cyanobacterium]